MPNHVIDVRRLIGLVTGFVSRITKAHFTSQCAHLTEKT
jgi:hypothetical protein